MKDEIKEILNDLRKYANEGGEHKLMEYEIKHIQCYITNLQEENEKLKIDNKRLQHNEKVFKSRNEKAIEYIKSLEEDSTDYDGEVIIGEIGTHCKDKLLNILNGDE